MQIIWRTLPKLALPAAIGLGVAYLVTSFVPRPAPNLRPPEELRAQGQAYGEESPVRIILERNVLKLESSLFYPLGQPLAPIVVPEPVLAAKPAANASAPAQAAFAQADTSVTPQVQSAAASPQGAIAGAPVNASAPLSGGSSVQGLAVRPDTSAPSQTPAPARQTELNTPPGAATNAQPTGAAKASAAVAVARPAAKAPAAASVVRSTPRQGLEGFRLVGVIAGGERPLAMLQINGAAVSLGLGQQVRGWTLISVEPGQVLLQNGEDQRRLEFGKTGPSPSAKVP